MNKVLQISFENGKVVKVWDSAIKVNSIGFNFNRVILVCKGKAKKSNGYFWVYEDKKLQDLYKVYPEDYIKNNTVANNKRKQVVMVDNNTLEIIKEYESRDAAAKDLNLHSESIMRALKTKTPINDKLLFDKEYYLNNKEEIKMTLSDECNEKCLICNLKFKNLRSLSSHLQIVHKIESIDYTIKYLLNLSERPKCKLCDNETRYCTFEFKDYCKEHSKEAMKLGGKKKSKKINNIP